MVQSDFQILTAQLKYKGGLACGEFRQQLQAALRRHDAGPH